MNKDQLQQEVLYALFILHALGKRAIEWTCPNCGPVVHIEEKDGKELIHTCMTCGCRSRSASRHEP